jgi:hypothetical protein
VWGIPHWAHLSEAELKAAAGGGRGKGGVERAEGIVRSSLMLPPLFALLGWLHGMVA